MNKQAPYDSFYSRLTQASVWFYTNILRFGKYEDESIVNFVDAKKIVMYWIMDVTLVAMLGW